MDKTLKDKTLQDETPKKSATSGSEARGTLWPASFLAGGIDYTFHAFAGTSLHASRLPAGNELFLWRLRNEWQLVSAMNGRDWLTLSERKRVKSHRNPAVGRQFGISRAVLRMVLSRMFCCEPVEVLLEDTPGGGVRINNTLDGRTVAVDIVHAGMWLVMAASIGHVGLGLMSPLIGRAVEESDKSTSHSQKNARELSHARTSQTFDAPLPQPAHWQTLDIPMPGQIRLAVTCERPVTCVTAFGWRR